MRSQEKRILDEFTREKTLFTEFPGEENYSVKWLKVTGIKFI